VKAIISVTAILVVVAGGLGYKMYSDHQAELAVERAERARIAEEAKNAQVEFDRKLSAIQKDMNDKLAKAQTEEERAKIRAEAAQQRAVAASSRSSSHHGSKSDSSPSAPQPRTVVKKKEVSDNPLEGL
jgi:peptidoglycan hydrolase CwlO-like protein